jgi:hypothetical protein
MEQVRCGASRHSVHPSLLNPRPRKNKLKEEEVKSIDYDYMRARRFRERQQGLSKGTKAAQLGWL